jgi:hypothetical protein
MAEKVDRVAELLGRKNDQPGTKPTDAAGRAETVLDGQGTRPPVEGQETPQAPPAPQKLGRMPASIAELADFLGIEPEKVYDLDIGFGDGAETKMKLGALKDAAGDWPRLDREISERQTAVETREGAIRDAEQHLASVYDLLKTQLSPDLQAQVGAAVQAQKQRAHAEQAVALRRAMPEMGNPEFVAQFERDAITQAARMGYTPAEVAGITDHRMLIGLRIMRDMAAQIAHLTRAIPEPAKPAPAIPPAQGRGQGGKRFSRPGNAAEQNRAISSLIRGK